MKKLIFGMSLFSAAMCFGDAANVLVTFSTPGPDKYADSTTVLDGECYALVYAVDGFEGVTADGAAADEKDSVLCVLSRAKSGRCPTTVFQVDSKVADALTGGSYGVVMLDTRLAPDAAGAVKLAPIDAQTGLPTAIAASTSVADSVSAASFAANAVTGGASSEAAIASADPEGAPKPVIKAIEVKGAYVYLTVNNTIPALQYGVKKVVEEVEGVKEVRWEGAGQPVQGAATTDSEITIVAPATGDKGLFQVMRK